MESYSNSSARVPESSRNREDRLQRRRERERARRASETAEQREERLRVRRARDRARRAAQTAEERDARLRQIRDNRHACAFELTLAPTMLCIHLVYTYGTCVFRIYTSCPICARCNISTLQVSSCNHCCSRDKTSRTERLNSGNQRNRDLKKARKGGTTSKTEADY